MQNKMTKQYSKNILHTYLSFFKTFSRPIGTRRKQEDENNWDNNNNGNFDNGQWNSDKYDNDNGQWKPNGDNGHWQTDDSDNQKQNNRNPGNRQQFRRPNKPNVNQWKPNNNGDNGQWKSGDEHQWKPPSEVKITNVNFKKTSNVTRPLSGDYKVVCCKKHIYSLFGIRNRRFMLKMNCLRKMLQNLQYFWNMKTHEVFSFFISCYFLFLSNECPGLYRH